VSNTTAVTFQSDEHAKANSKPEPESLDRGQVTLVPASNNYYGSHSSINEDQKIPDTPEPLGECHSLSPLGLNTCAVQ